MRILVVGDSYLGTSVFADGLRALEDFHSLEFLQLDGAVPFSPQTRSELAIREYEGSPATVAERMEGVEVLVVHGAPVTEDVLDASAELRLVCCARGGPVNVDVAAATERGIPVSTTPGKNAEAVADQAIAFLIMLARGFPRAQRFLAQGGRIGEEVFEGAEFFGRELAAQTLGLVGFGHVGRSVARRALAFGMRLTVFDPYLVEAPGERIERVDDLAQLLGEADFVSLHARATAENENLFDGQRFATMREGAFFLNTARETLVDEQALDDALTSGHLAGAALDVVRPGNWTGPHPLLRHDNVIITPHIGGATLETLQRGATMLAEEIFRFAAGEPLRHVANGVAAGA
jgi:D-3-phosphoglycerate dehydrogenase